MIQQPGCTRPPCSPIGSLHPTWDDPEMDQGMPDEHKRQHDARDMYTYIFHRIVSFSSGMKFHSEHLLLGEYFSLPKGSIAY